MDKGQVTARMWTGCAAALAALAAAAGARGGEEKDGVKIALEGRTLMIQGNRQPLPADAFATPDKSRPRVAELLKPVLGARDAEGRCPVRPAISVDEEAPYEALQTVLMAVASHGCRGCTLAVKTRDGKDRGEVPLPLDDPKGGKGDAMTLKLLGEGGREKLDLDGQQIPAANLEPLAPPLKEAAKSKALIRIRAEGKTSAARAIELVRFCRTQGAERFELIEQERPTQKQKEDAKEAKDAVDRALDGIKVGK